jgi:uncharacterized protein (TIRG00374 family)
MRTATSADTNPPPRSKRRALLKGLRVLGPAAACCLLWFTFKDTRADALANALRNVGPAALLVLLPFPISMAVESVAWRRLFLVLGQRVSFWRLYRIRMEAEALLYSLPTGSMLAETLKPYLLRQRCGVALPEAMATLAAKRFLLVFTHAFYLLAGVLLAWRSLARHPVGVVGVQGLQWLGLIAGGVVLTAALLLAALCANASPIRRLHRTAGIVRWRPWRSALERLAAAATRTDERLRRLFTSPREWLGGAALLFFMAWAWESAETYLLLRLLGAPVHFSEVLAIETLLTIVRSLTAFVPAGLGFQDAGYVSFLAGLGVSDAVTLGAAFVLMKRGKELFWILFGYLSLAWGHRRPAALRSEPMLAISAGEVAPFALS